VLLLIYRYILPKNRIKRDFKKSFCIIKKKVLSLDMKAKITQEEIVIREYKNDDGTFDIWSYYKNDNSRPISVEVNKRKKDLKLK